MSSSQVQKQRPTKSDSAEADASEVRQGEKSKEARAKIEAMDELLDEVDGLLEENAEAFVTGRCCCPDCGTPYGRDLHHDCSYKRAHNVAASELAHEVGGSVERTTGGLAVVIFPSDVLV